MSELVIIFSAFLAGILGSVHCIGMCSGIACSASYMQVDNNKRFLGVIKFNLGRVFTYSVLGAIVGFIGSGLVKVSNAQQIISSLRIFSAMLIALIGLKYVFGLAWIDLLEKLGQRLWERINLGLFNGRRTLQSIGLLPLGLLWGLLPCGLIYTMLVTAAATSSSMNGFLVMLAFGFGTLPSMAGLGFFATSFKTQSERRWLRLSFGIAFLCLATFLIFLELKSGGHEHRHH